MSEKTTSEVALLAGVTRATIRKWKMRGDLPNAPIGRAGQGRSVECMWSEKAVAEFLERAAQKRTTGHRNTTRAGEEN